MDMNFVVEFYRVFGGPKPLTPEELKNFNEELRADQITPNTNNFDSKQTYAIKSGKHENILDRLFGVNMWSAHIVPGTTITTVSQQVVRDNKTKEPRRNEDGSIMMREHYSSRSEVVFMVPNRAIIHTVIGASDNFNRNYAETGMMTAALSLILKRVAPGVRLLWENELSDESTPKTSYKPETQASTNSKEQAPKQQLKWLDPKAPVGSDKHNQWMSALNKFRESDISVDDFVKQLVASGWGLYGDNRNYLTKQ